MYTAPEYKNLISNYEDISIEKSVEGQIELAGCEVSEEESADLLLIVNNFEEAQGEIVMKRPTKAFSKEFAEPQRPYMIADVRFANGADNAFVSKLFETGINAENFYGYSAWNTSANSLGSLICAAKIKWFAKKYNAEAFKNLEAARFLDDWAYQANVRQMLEYPDINDLSVKMKPFEKHVSQLLNITVSPEYKFPWDRLFEVEIELN